MPLIEEEIDGLSGLLFPFYDADTHMLYLAGKVGAAHHILWLRGLQRHRGGDTKGPLPSKQRREKSWRGSRAVLSPEQSVGQPFGHRTLVGEVPTAGGGGQHPVG